jgi:predicted transcriptional regulator
MLDAEKTANEIAVELNRTRLAIYARLQQIDRKSARVARLLDNRLKAEAK